MIFICMLITSTATTILAKGFIECNLSEPTGAHQCFGEMGQPLTFNLPNTTNREVHFTKDKDKMFKIRNNQIISHDESVVFTKQTFKFNKATKWHSGDYTMVEFGLNGNRLKEVKVHLEIQAPVSEPAVSQTCLSPEQMEVSCSSEGDEVQFILSLDDHLVMKTKSHNQSQQNWIVGTQSFTIDKQDTAHILIISLFGQLTGNLTCRVWNNVSRDEKVIHLNRCKDFAPGCPVVTIALKSSVATLLLLMALCVCLRYLRNTRKP